MPAVIAVYPLMFERKTNELIALKGSHLPLLNVLFKANYLQCNYFNKHKLMGDWYLSPAIITLSGKASCTKNNNLTYLFHNLLTSAFNKAENWPALSSEFTL
ncbi:hypothetical protein GCM10027037_04050 [Mucilaginibacter koreensis]